MINNDSQIFCESPVENKQRIDISKINNEIIENFSKIITKGDDFGDMSQDGLDYNDIVNQLNHNKHYPLKNQFDFMNTLFNEDIQIISYFTDQLKQKMKKLKSKLKSNNTLRSLIEMIDNLVFELKIRHKEKSSLLTKIKKEMTEKDKALYRNEKVINKLKQEIKLFKDFNQLKKNRQIGNMEPKMNVISNSQDSIDNYDLIIQTEDVFNINKEGIRFDFSTNSQKTNVFKEYYGIVSVLGQFGKGKTFLLNNLFSVNLPFGKRSMTKGLSVKNVKIENDINMMLIDSEGLSKPNNFGDKRQLKRIEITENFMIDFISGVSDYFLYVINDFTVFDQRIISKVLKQLKNDKKKQNIEVIVVHNYRDIESEDILKSTWKKQVEDTFDKGIIRKTKIAAYNPISGKLEEKEVTWLKTEHTRHVYIVNQDSILGLNSNPWSFSILKYWLKGVNMFGRHKKGFIDIVKERLNSVVNDYFGAEFKLELEGIEDKKTKYLKIKGEEEKGQEKEKINFLDLYMNRFKPQIDIVAGEKYIIIIDLPGSDKDSIVVKRENIYTVVSGEKNKPELDTSIKKEEFQTRNRSMGTFYLKLKIPKQYERKWASCEITNGILVLMYNKDIESVKDD